MKKPASAGFFTLRIHTRQAVRSIGNAGAIGSRAPPTYLLQQCATDLPYIGDTKKPGNAGLFRVTGAD
jgi:hypothetical protein